MQGKELYQKLLGPSAPGNVQQEDLPMKAMVTTWSTIFLLPDEIQAEKWCQARESRWPPTASSSAPAEASRGGDGKVPAGLDLAWPTGADDQDWENGQNRSVRNLECDPSDGDQFQRPIRQDDESEDQGNYLSIQVSGKIPDGNYAPSKGILPLASWDPGGLPPHKPRKSKVVFRVPHQFYNQFHSVRINRSGLMQVNLFLRQANSIGSMRRSKQTVNFCKMDRNKLNVQ